MLTKTLVLASLDEKTGYTEMQRGILKPQLSQGQLRSY